MTTHHSLSSFNLVKQPFPVPSGILVDTVSSLDGVGKATEAFRTSLREAIPTVPGKKPSINESFVSLLPLVMSSFSTDGRKRIPRVLCVDASSKLTREAHVAIDAFARGQLSLSGWRRPAADKLTVVFCPRRESPTSPISEEEKSIGTYLSNNDAYNYIEAKVEEKHFGPFRYDKHDSLLAACREVLIAPYPPAVKLTRSTVSTLVPYISWIIDVTTRSLRDDGGVLVIGAYFGAALAVTVLTVCKHACSTSGAAAFIDQDAQDADDWCEKKTVALAVETDSPVRKACNFLFPHIRESVSASHYAAAGRDSSKVKPAPTDMEDAFIALTAIIVQKYYKWNTSGRASPLQAETIMMRGIPSQPPADNTGGKKRAAVEEQAVSQKRVRTDGEQAQEQVHGLILPGVPDERVRGSGSVPATAVVALLNPKPSSPSTSAAGGQVTPSSSPLRAVSGSGVTAATSPVEPVQVVAAPVQVVPAPVEVVAAPVQVVAAPVQVVPAPVQVAPAPVQVAPPSAVPTASTSAAAPATALPESKEDVSDNEGEDHEDEDDDESDNDAGTGDHSMEASATSSGTTSKLFLGSVISAFTDFVPSDDFLGTPSAGAVTDSSTSSSSAHARQLEGLDGSALSLAKVIVGIASKLTASVRGQPTPTVPGLDTAQGALQYVRLALNSPALSSVSNITTSKDLVESALRSMNSLKDVLAGVGGAVQSVEAQYSTWNAFVGMFPVLATLKLTEESFASGETDAVDVIAKKCRSGCSTFVSTMSVFLTPPLFESMLTSQASSATLTSRGPSVESSTSLSRVTGALSASQEKCKQAVAAVDNVLIAYSDTLSPEVLLKAEKSDEHMALMRLMVMALSFHRSNDVASGAGAGRPTATASIHSGAGRKGSGSGNRGSSTSGSGANPYFSPSSQEASDFLEMCTDLCDIVAQCIVTAHPAIGRLLNVVMKTNPGSDDFYMAFTTLLTLKSSKLQAHSVYLNLGKNPSPEAKKAYPFLLKVEECACNRAASLVVQSSGKAASDALFLRMSNFSAEHDDDETDSDDANSKFGGFLCQVGIKQFTLDPTKKDLLHSKAKSLKTYASNGILLAYLFYAVMDSEVILEALQKSGSSQARDEAIERLKQFKLESSKRQQKALTKVLDGWDTLASQFSDSLKKACDSTKSKRK